MSPINAATVVPRGTAGASPCTASTTPTSSMPRIRGNVTASPAYPFSVLYSDRLSPNASTLTSAQPGRGSGRGTSRTTSPSGPSGRSATTARICAMGPSGQVGGPGVCDRRIRQDVDQRRLAGLERPLHGAAELRGLAHELAVAAERLDDLVVARLRPQVGGHRVSVEELHRVLLEPPDPVVAHHADDVDAVARERVELHPGEPEGPVARQQAALLVGPGELRGQRVAGPGAQAPVRARVQPAAGRVGVDDAAGVRDEVPAVADDHGVAVEHLAELLVQAHRVQ